ncbi:MAG TPA: flagellar type III secretion system protein FlhB [Chromatiaceae bacterium]|nr:flagellar type III secretion system protein FlhB [Chromatiaceae bacterium]
MAENPSSQERTEQPTPKRLKDAREKGQVPRSRELNTLVVLMVSAAGLLLLGRGMAQDFTRIMQRGFSLEREMVMDSAAVTQYLASSIGEGLLLMAPLFGLLLVAAILGPLGLGGWSFSTKAIAFKMEKLNPVKGLGRIFSAKGLMELAKTLAKFLLVAAASAVILWSQLGDLLSLSGESVEQALVHAGTLCLWAFLLISSVRILVALVDVPFQLWQHKKQLKMTLKEVKDEQKETEGSPEMKGRIRAAQREMAQRRMMQEVPGADVVITNPTHYSVALRYDQEGADAPKVVAKGTDLIALQIRRIAEANGVPVVAAPPLARALHALAELDREIPAELYVAVAHILAYVYQLNTASGRDVPPPPAPEELPVPEEFR